MKIYYQKLNKGEKYCCSLSAVKTKFKNVDIKVNFGSFGRKYCPCSNEIGYNYYKKYIKGTVISKFVMEYDNCNSMISFYVVNENEYSLALFNKFETEILDQILNFYINSSLVKYKFSSLLVELFEGELIIHKHIKK